MSEIKIIGEAEKPYVTWVLTYKEAEYLGFALSVAGMSDDLGVDIAMNADLFNAIDAVLDDDDTDPDPEPLNDNFYDGHCAVCGDPLYSDADVDDGIPIAAGPTGYDSLGPD